jgi:hypothetical protein
LERGRKRDRKGEKKIAMKNIIIIIRTGPPQHARKLYQNGGRSRTIADGAQVVACSYRLLLYVTIGEFIFQCCHPLIIKYVTEFVCNY